MLVKYTIHRIGTPKISLPNHWTEFESEYWSNEDGWGFKSTATVFTEEEKNTLNLPMEGEWVEIYVNEPLEEKNENR